MKNLLQSLLAFLAISVLTGSCQSNCTKKIYYTAKEPIYEHMDAIRDQVRSVESKPLGFNIEEMAVNEGWIFLRDSNAGIHVIDARLPGSAINHSYINMPGCLGITAWNNYLYAVQGRDIIALNVSDPNNVVVEGRSPSGLNRDFVRQDSFIVGYREYEKVMIIENARCSGVNFIEEIREPQVLTTIPLGALKAQNDHLYVTDGLELAVMSIRDPKDPTITSRQSRFTSPDFRTQIELNDSFAYVGVPNSMTRFDIISTPSTPINRGSFFASRGCGMFAVDSLFVYLAGFRTGGEDTNPNCRPLDELAVVDLTFAGFPRVRQRSFLDRAMHVTVENRRALVCQGSFGFGLFDISDVTQNIPTELDRIELDARMGIIDSDVVYVWGFSGLGIFDRKQDTFQHLATVK